jgi:predicted RND superfamily exporter protein
VNLHRAHEAIESGFEAWGRSVVRLRWLVTVGLLAATALLALQIPSLRTDNSAESFLLPSDPARIDYDRFRAQFGQDDQIVVLLKPPEVFDLGFLGRLREIHEALERDVPYVAEVTSLLNVRNTRGEGDTLVVEDLLETWPRSESDLAALRARVLETPLYVDNLVDRDGEITTLLVKPFVYSTLEDDEFDALAGFEQSDAQPGDGAGFLSDEESNAMVEALQEVTSRFHAPDLEIHLSGGAIGNQHSTKMMMRDVQIFLSLSIAMIAVVLFVLFRRISAVVLPLAVVLLSLVTTLGIQAAMEIPASVSNQVVPPLLLAVGVCGAIHLLALVYRSLAAGETREDAIAAALRHSGLAIAMASFTTAAGLVSFRAAELGQIANFGTIAPIGVLVALGYVLTLLPALLALVPLRAERPGGDALQAWLRMHLARVGVLATRHPWRVLAATGLVTVVGAVGAARLQFSQYPLAWFPEDDPVRLGAELIDAELGGANTLEVVIDTGEENGLYDPARVGRLARAVEFAESYDDGEIAVAKVISILDVLRETHKALNGNEHAYYTIPDDRRLLAQELLLFENSGSDDLEELTDSRLQLARVSLRIPLVDDLLYVPFIEKMEQGFRAHLGDGVGVEVTGMGALFGRTFAVLNISMARSYALALAIIVPLLLLLIGNLRQGLVAMVPNLLPVFLTLALMGFLGISLDNSTLLVGCIIIGLAVDDTIHFMHKFQRYYGASGDVETAVRRTLETTGSALLFTSIVLSCGFSVMLFAYMENVADFGLLATFAAVVAFIADVVLAPALLVLITERRTAGALGTEADSALRASS